MQVGSIVIPNLGIPQWVLSGLILLIILGFPVAIVLAWAFELTPDGIKATQNEHSEKGMEPGSNDLPPKANLKPILLAAAVPSILFGALALFFFFRSTSSDNPGVATEKSIAVLPLENLSPDADNAFFADGVQEDILTHLFKINDLVVISRSSTLRYRSRDRNLKVIGEELGVRYVVEGSVRRAGEILIAFVGFR